MKTYDSSQNSDNLGNIESKNSNDRFYDIYSRENPKQKWNDLISPEEQEKWHKNHLALMGLNEFDHHFYGSIHFTDSKRKLRKLPPEFQEKIVMSFLGINLIYASFGIYEGILSIHGQILAVKGQQSFSSDVHILTHVSSIKWISSVNIIEIDFGKAMIFNGTRCFSSESNEQHIFTDYSKENKLRLGRIINDFNTDMASNLLKANMRELNQGFYPHEYQYLLLDKTDKTEVEELIKSKIMDRDIQLKQSALPMADTVHALSQSQLDLILTELEIHDYAFVDITRSSRDDLSPGTYIYQISKNGDIAFMRNPLKLLIDRDGNPYHVFDKGLYQNAIDNIVKIPNESVKDFQLFGSELMINKVQTFDNNELHGTIDNPKLLGTAFNEMLFGTSFSLLKGMSGMMQQLNQSIIANKVNIETISSIKDTRVVQVTFIDKTDIELCGVMIYYDFNRKMGRAHNKEDVKESTLISKDSGSENNQLTKLKEYKQMLSEGLIDEDEFRALKNKLLGL